MLAIGTVEPRKDYPLLVSAFGPVAAAHPDVALVMVGGDGWGAERFPAAVEASPARSRIVRPGYLDDAALAAALRHASVLAYPSRLRGVRLPSPPGHGGRRPRGGHRGRCRPRGGGGRGRAGRRRATPTGLAGAISRVLDGGSEIDEQVARGRRRSAGFTWEACADGLARPLPGRRRAAGIAGPGRPDRRGGR